MVSPGPVRPPRLVPRQGPGAHFTYHPPTNTLVLFGGQNKTEFLRDTWLWNGRSWSAVPGAGPPARTGAGMAFDPATGSLILVGGFNPDHFMNDTWKWNGTSWRALTPGSSPPRLTGASLAYGSTLGRLVLFGGRGGMGGPVNGTTWAWNGTNWSYLPMNPSPPPRAFASMTGIPGGGPVFLFGGKSIDALLGDTWMLTSTWSQVTVTPAPPPRAYASLVPDPSSNSLLLFGGQSDSSLLGDTWAWGPFSLNGRGGRR